MSRTAVLREIDGLLELDPGTLRGSEKLSELKEWDSVAVMSFISFADEKFGKQVLPGKLLQCATVDDLADLIEG